MSEASGGDSSGGVPKELASLVPSFDPATDNVEIWTSKVELLLATWPTTKLNELATRLILGCKGTAYQKLQLLRGEVLIGSEKGIQRLVEIVGGTWGQVPLEKKFELAEKALYRSMQKGDESADSYLSRCDVVWTELLAKKMSLQELQAYIVLRGSKLAPEDKKRVIVESKDAEGSALTMPNVTSAIRLLGSGFFQEYTGLRRDKNAKTYDHTAYHMDEELESEHDAFVAHDDALEDDVLEALAAENDEDAILVMQFEDSISETIQSDAELSAFYSTYQDARRRLTERVKVRGFWPVGGRRDKGGKKGRGKGKGKFQFGGQGSLAKRIANSFCRICMQKGHWKNECPQRPGASANAASNSANSSVAPTSVVVTDEIPSEIAHFTIVEGEDTSVEPPPQLFCRIEYRVMASVTQKLQQFREIQKKDEDSDQLTKIRAMPLEVLAKEKIAFGQAKLGQAFPEVFQDAKWTDWFIRTYERSAKPEHQLFVQYVTKRLDAEIYQDKGVKPPAHLSDGSHLKEMKEKAPKSDTSDHLTWDHLTEPDFLPDCDLPGINKLQQMEDQVANLNVANKNLSDRMAGVEMALTEVLQHVRNLSVKSEP
eukprot:s2532_g30.t1